jgi:hypothetical protein
MKSARTTLATKAGAVAVYDFAGEGAQKSRLVAALAETAGNTWFLKMVGDAQPVGAARADFLNLVQSLHHVAN